MEQTCAARPRVPNRGVSMTYVLPDLDYDLTWLI